MIHIPLQALQTHNMSENKVTVDECVLFPHSDGLIKAVGPAETIRAQYAEALFDKVIDAAGMCVLPGEHQLCISSVGLNISSQTCELLRISCLSIM